MAVYPDWFAGVRLIDFQRLVHHLFLEEPIRETAESGIPMERLKGYSLVMDLVDSPLLRDLALTEAGILNRIGYHAHRLYPYAQNDYGAYRWHFDGRPEWPVKAMLLLTEVDENGQAMVYIKGPPTFRKFANYDESRWPLVNEDPPGEQVPVVGKAGTLWLFDAWCWHRGVRKMAPVRDTFTIEWTKVL